MSDVRTGFARTADGLQLYWRSLGDPASPAMVCCNGVGVSTFFWKYVAQHFKDRFHVILWDYRGHGLSAVPADPTRADMSIERAAQDLAVVLDNVAARTGAPVPPAVLLGHSMGCQVILEFTRQFPERVRALIPMFGTFAKPMDTFMDSPHSRPAFGIIKKIADLGGKNGSRWLRPLYASPLALPIGRASGMVDRYYSDSRDLEMYLEHLNHMDTRVFLRMVELMADHDLTDFLPSIRVPTLVVAGEHDLFTPLHRSQAMAAAIPGAELMVLPEGSHAAIVEHPETINRRVERFVAERLG